MNYSCSSFSLLDDGKISIEFHYGEKIMNFALHVAHLSYETVLHLCNQFVYENNGSLDQNYRLEYVDTENERVAITSTEEFVESCRVFLNLSSKNNTNSNQSAYSILCYYIEPLISGEGDRTISKDWFDNLTEENQKAMQDALAQLHKSYSNIKKFTNELGEKLRGVVTNDNSVLCNLFPKTLSTQTDKQANADFGMQTEIIEGITVSAQTISPKKVDASVETDHVVMNDCVTQTEKIETKSIAIQTCSDEGQKTIETQTAFMNQQNTMETQTTTEPSDRSSVGTQVDPEMRTQQNVVEWEMVLPRLQHSGDANHEKQPPLKWANQYRDIVQVFPHVTYASCEKLLEQHNGDVEGVLNALMDQ